MARKISWRFLLETCTAAALEAIGFYIVIINDLLRSAIAAACKATNQMPTGISTWFHLGQDCQHPNMLTNELIFLHHGHLG